MFVRLLKQAHELSGASVLCFVNHHRVAKKRAKAVWYARGAVKRQPLFRDLLAAQSCSIGESNPRYQLPKLCAYLRP